MHANNEKKHKKSSENKVLYSVLEENQRWDLVESYKMLRTNIELISAADRCKLIEIVSSEPDEGKSNVVVNLAYTIAQNNKKVCVVDCDLRKPSLYKYYKASEKTPGLTNYLMGNHTLDDILLEDNDVKILLSGPVPPNASEILNSDKMKALIKVLDERFDYVIFDTAPITQVTDAIVLGNSLDGAIIIIRQNYSDSRIVKDAKKALDTANIKVIGAAITNYSSNNKSSYYYKKKGYGYGYGYGYGSNNK